MAKESRFKRFLCKRITMLNLDSGTCKLVIDGYDYDIRGRINDLSIETPGNIYSAALDSHTSFFVFGTVQQRKGKVKTLFINSAEG